MTSKPNNDVPLLGGYTRFEIELEVRTVLDDVIAPVCFIMLTHS